MQANRLFICFDVKKRLHLRVVFGTLIYADFKKKRKKKRFCNIMELVYNSNKSIIRIMKKNNVNGRGNVLNCHEKSIMQ